MKRIACIGAQSVEATELTVRTPLVEMPCRRSSDAAQHHTYYRAMPEALPDSACQQLVLFAEDPQAVSA